MMGEVGIAVAGSLLLASTGRVGTSVGNSASTDIPCTGEVGDGTSVGTATSVGEAGSMTQELIKAEDPDGSTDGKADGCCFLSGNDVGRGKAVGTSVLTSCSSTTDVGD